MNFYKVLTFSFFLFLFSCNNSDVAPKTDTKTDASIFGKFKAVLAGSSGHFTMDINKDDSTKNTLSFHFDQDQDGTDDIIIDTTGAHVTAEGFEHTDGTTIKVKTDSDGGYTADVTVPNHENVSVLVQEDSDDNYIMYRGEMGSQEVVYALDSNGIPRGSIDSVATKALTKPAILSKVVFNLLLSKKDNKFKYITKGIELNFDLVDPNITQAEIDEIKKEVDSHVNEVAEGTYVYDQTGKTYTFTLENGKTEVLKLDEATNMMSSSDFGGLLCDQELILAITPERDTVSVRNNSNVAVQGDFKLCACFGQNQKQYVNGIEVAATGKYFLGSSDISEITVIVPPGSAETKTAPRAILDYVLVKKVE